MHIAYGSSYAHSTRPHSVECLRVPEDQYHTLPVPDIHIFKAGPLNPSGPEGTQLGSKLDIHLLL